jgi:hypothetical protein
MAMSALDSCSSRVVALWGCALIGCIAPAEEPPELHLEPLTAQRTTLVQGIGDAENATFSPDGRLFVTGGENAYEIVREGEVYRARPLYRGVCNFTGIAVHADHLYTTCAEGPDLARSVPRLLAAPLGPEMELEVIYDFEQLAIPNGVAFDRRGRLFVTDFAPLAGKIVTVEFDPSDPMLVARERVWHAMNHPLANGLKIYEDRVYLTDLTDIKIIPIAADGSAGRARVLASRLAVLDDLYVDARGIIVSDFYGGRLLWYGHDGRMREQSDRLFDAPSSITPGRAPLVPEGSLLVTEKGALGELTSSDGNRLSLLE